MIPDITFRQWRGMFMERIKHGKREEAFNILENMRMFSQMSLFDNQMSDEQVDHWFEMLEAFNEAFPDKPVYFEIK